MVWACVADPASSALLRATMLDAELRRCDIMAMLEAAFGNSRHLWMWDYEGIAYELAAAGFRCITRARLGDNPAPHWAEVEEEDRWRDCLGFERKR